MAPYDSLQEAWDRLIHKGVIPAVKRLIQVAQDIAMGPEYKSVATPREWHVYMHGKPRTHKKWRAIFQKRLRRQGR